MKKKVILFNGAPNSGKDASASILKELFGYGSIHAFKDELYKATAKHYDVDLDHFVEIARDRVLKETKNRILVNNKGKTLLSRIVSFVMNLFVNQGVSPRQALIHVSEDLIKPVHGNDYFGKQLANTITMSNQENFYIPDSGFIDELRPLVEAGFEIYVIRIHREGCTFQNDSRSYMTDELLSEFGLVGIDLHNNGTLDDLKQNLLNIATDNIVLGNKR